MLRFFESYKDTAVSPQPNEMYRDLEQAFINEQWDNTSAKQTILEEDMVDGVFQGSYHETEAWLNYVVGQTSTGTKEGRDFVQLIFRSIEHKVIRGRYYQFEGNYWLGDFTDTHQGLVADMTVRRCNNFLRIIDPENGEVKSYPCVVGYDMSSPAVQTSTHIITPNNHATVMVQGNADTLRLFKTNTRYILGGRPFKLTGYQNAIEYSLEHDIPNLLYLDLYLDEIHPRDDLVNQLADNGEFNYEVTIVGQDMELTQGSTGQLFADVMLNGEEVQREVQWSTSDKTIVEVSPNGAYAVVGAIGDFAVITAKVGASEDTLTITVADESSIEAEVFIDPMISKIAEFDTAEFTIGAIYGGVEYRNFDNVVVTLEDDGYIKLEEEDGVYRLTALKRTKAPQKISIAISNLSPAFEAQNEIEIDVTAMW